MHPLNKILIVILTVLITMTWGDIVVDQISASFSGKKLCPDFIYQEYAQRALLSNPQKYGKLDGDHDGIDCESLPHRP